MAGLVILATTTLHAQQNPGQDAPANGGSSAVAANQWFARIGYSPARVVATREFQSGENGARAVTVEIGRQTDGTRDWHRVYNYPSYGVGFYAGRFDRERELGRPVGAYGFFSWPFPVSERAQVTADLRLGLSWNWHPYDADSNPTNTALGSAAAYHADGGVSFRYLATNRASLYAGVDVAHWSNGAAKQPNLGLAIVGPQIGVRYNFAPQPAHARAPRENLAPFVPAWEFIIGAAGSSKSAVAAAGASPEGIDRRCDFGAANVTAALQRHFYRFGKIAAGADLTYDGATGARIDTIDARQVESRAPVDRRFGFGVYGGYEHVIARLSVLAQFGYTAWRGVDDPEVPRFYQRFGARFHLSERLWGTFAVRSVKLRRANFMELGAGYRVRW